MSARGRCVARCASVAALVLACAPPAARAQILRETRFRGSLSVGGEVRRQTTRAPGQEDRRFDERRADEELALQVEGSVLSPRLLGYSLGGTVGLRQGQSQATFAEVGNDDGLLLGYDAIANLLPSSAVSLSLFANRYQDRINQSFGSDTTSSGELLGSSLRLGAPWFPSVLSWRRLGSDVESNGAAFPSRRSETRTTIEYTGDRFTDTSQVLLRLRDEDVADDSFPPSDDYHIREASGLLGHRFGEYLDKSLRSSMRYFDRRGDSNFRAIAGSGTFDWAITEQLETLFEYDYNRFDTDESPTNEHTGTFSLSHELFQSLRTNLNLFANDSQREDGGRVTYGSNLSLGYRKRLPWDSRLFVDVRGGYRWQQNDFQSDLVQVHNETLVVDTFAGNELANPRVDPDTIEVFLGVSGPRLIEDIDYEVEQFGDRVEIVVIPGGIVGIGDVLAVNYAFAINPSATTGTRSYSAGVGWSNRWLTLRYDHDREKERQFEGDERDTLQDATRDGVQVELSGELAGLEATAAVEVARERTETFDFDEIGLSQSLRWQARRNLDLFVYAREGRRQFVSPERRTGLLASGTGLTWRFGIDSRLRAYVEFRSYQDTQSRSQEDVEVGVRGQIRIGRFEILPGARWTRRSRGQLETDDMRAGLTLRRSF